jgi:hypothetical protein
VLRVQNLSVSNFCRNLHTYAHHFTHIILSTAFYAHHVTQSNLRTAFHARHFTHSILRTTFQAHHSKQSVQLQMRLRNAIEKTVELLQSRGEKSESDFFQSKENLSVATLLNELLAQWTGITTPVLPKGYQIGRIFAH